MTAYEENTVPTDAAFPYVTYQLVTDSFDREVAATASLWYRGESWTDINEKTEDIARFIGGGGCLLDCDSGFIWLKRGTPFAQNMGDESDDLIKRKYINVTVEYMTAN